MTTDIHYLAGRLACADGDLSDDRVTSAWAELLSAAQHGARQFGDGLAREYDTLAKDGPDRSGRQTARIERLLSLLPAGAVEAVGQWLDDAPDDDDGDTPPSELADTADDDDWLIYDPLSDTDDALQFSTSGDDSGEHWVTIGAHRGDDGRKHGGVPVLIRGGKIVDGPARLKGRKLSSFGKGKAPDSKLDHAVKSAAKEHRLPAKDLRDAVHFVHSEKLRTHQQRESAKSMARKATGLTAGDISRLANAGHDYASAHKAGGATAAKFKHFDEVAQEVAREHPELGLGDADAKENFAENLWHVLAEGKREPLAKHHPEVIDEAVTLLKSSRPAKKADKRRYKEMNAIPFSNSRGR